MSKKAADRDNLRQPESERKIVLDLLADPAQEIVKHDAVADRTVKTEESVLSSELIPPHYALQDFNQVKGNQIFTQKKGDIIRDQQRLNLYKQQNAPIAPFDEWQMAKCPNSKCGCVFAWAPNSKQRV